MPKTAKKTRYELTCPDPRLVCGKVDDGSPHTIEGYLAVFGNVDFQGDRIVKGAFKKSIQDKFGKGGKGIPLMVRHAAHGGDTPDVVGTIREAREDENGLWVKADLSSVPLAQETYTKISEGHVSGMSVGFYTIRHEWIEEASAAGGKSQICELKELALVEGTITTFPANELAGVTGFKSEEVAAITARLEAIEGKINQKKDEHQNAGNTEGKAAAVTPSAVSTELDKAANDLWIMSAKTRLERIRTNEDFERTPCPDGGPTP